MSEFIAPISKGTRLIQMQMKTLAMPTITLSELMASATAERSKVDAPQTDESIRFGNGGYTLSTVLALV